MSLKQWCIRHKIYAHMQKFFCENELTFFDGYEMDMRQNIYTLFISSISWTEFPDRFEHSIELNPVSDVERVPVQASLPHNTSEIFTAVNIWIVFPGVWKLVVWWMFAKIL
jgi:hypothetical protein